MLWITIRNSETAGVKHKRRTIRPLSLFLPTFCRKRYRDSKIYISLFIVQTLRFTLDLFTLSLWCKHANGRSLRLRAGGDVRKRDGEKREREGREREGK